MEPKYDKIFVFNSSFIYHELDRVKKILNVNSGEEFQPDYTILKELCNGYFLITNSCGSRGGMDSNLNIVIDTIFNNIVDYKHSSFLLYKDFMVGILDSNMKIKIPVKFKSILEFNGESAIVRCEDSIYIANGDQKEKYNIYDKQSRKQLCEIVLKGYDIPAINNGCLYKFWKLIDETKNKNFNSEEQYRKLESILKCLSNDEVLEYKEMWDIIFDRYYSNPTFMYLKENLGGICSGYDDTYSDFIGWTIMQGKELHDQFFNECDFGVIVDYINNKITKQDYEFEMFSNAFSISA